MNHTKIRRETLSVVSKAHYSGEIDRGEFTLAVARGRVEKALGMEVGQLGQGEMKSLIKGWVSEGLEELAEDAQDSQTTVEATLKLKKLRSSPKFVSKSSARSKAKVVESSSSHSAHISSAPIPSSPSTSSSSSSSSPSPSLSESRSKTMSKSKSSVKHAQDHSSTLSRKKSSGGGSALSREIIIDSDDSDQAPDGEEGAEFGKQKDDSEGDRNKRAHRQGKLTKHGKGSGKGKRKSKSEDDDDDDEGVGKPESKSLKRKKTANNDNNPEGVDKDEEKVAELKRIVVACGVRKQWAKEFAEAPTPRDQIVHLQNLLRSLGMKGAPTLGKAKGLKLKRELAAELNDVKEYEAVRGLSASKGDGKGKRESRSKMIARDSGEDDSQDDTGSHQSEKEQSALGAVLDFLGEEEEDSD